MVEIKEFEIHIKEQHVAQRLDSVIAEILQQAELPLDSLQPTRSKVAKWIQAGIIKVNSTVIDKSSYRVRLADYIQVPIPKVEPLVLEADASIDLSIVFEDEDLLVIDKAAGIAVHPGTGNKTGTLINGVLAHLGNSFDVGQEFRPGIVHRLDKDTSGLLVIAKNDFSYQALVAQFLPPRTIHRRYLALVGKAPKGKTSGSIDKPIGRDHRNRTKMAIVEDGKNARSDWTLVEDYKFGALLSVTLHTGRTHQIRVHLASESAAILADPLYGTSYGNISGSLHSAIKKLGRQALHASELRFIHPRTKIEVAFTSDIPQDMKQLITILSGL